MQRTQTEAIYTSLKKVLPGGVNSPARSFPNLEMTPLIAKSGKGDMLYDVDGHGYIDYCQSWGALILGHAHPYVVDATCEQVRCGSSFGVSTDVENKLAQKVIDIVPSIEKMRFVNSGTEAVMTAIRLARGFTGRDQIVKFEGNYHGHFDDLLVKAGSYLHHLNEEASSKGVPSDSVRNTINLPFNDLKALEKFFAEYDQLDQIACICIEPVAGNMGVVPASSEFINRLRELTEMHGILLIFDEVINGFRVGLKGASEMYGIVPDLITFGKIIGGGFPVAALGGSAEIMDYLAPLGQVFQAGTLSGNPVAMSAGLAVMEKITQIDVYQTLQAKVDLLLKPIEEKIQGGCVQRVGSMFSIFWGVDRVETSHDLARVDQKKFKHFFHYLIQNGIYIPPSPFEASFVSLAHTESHLKKTRDVILKYL